MYPDGKGHKTVNAAKKEFLKKMSYYEQTKIDSVLNYYLFSLKEIEDLQKQLDPGKLEALKNDMEDLFAQDMESVTTKEIVPSGCSPHDYVSLATYWWPNEETDTGYPYIRRDGFVNPEGARYDKDKYKRLAYLVYHGTLLYFLSREDRYLKLVKQHLYHWFINEDTRMNPHLEYGQFIPGTVRGRAEGIIDYGASFSYTLNMIHLLDQKKLLDPDLREGLRDWHSAFRTWLLESAIGRQEQQAENNHGTFYDVTLFGIEQFLGLEESIKARCDSFVKERIETQIAPDHSLPRETARTRSLSYALMGLKGLLDGAKLLHYQGMDLFPFLKGTVDWFCDKAIVHRASWTYPQVTPFDEGAFLLFRYLLIHIYGPEYDYIARYVDTNSIVNKVIAYLF